MTDGYYICHGDQFVMWKCKSKSVCSSVLSNSLHSVACSPPGSSIHRILWARILERVANPFIRGCPPPRDWTPVSCIAGGFFTIWATRESFINFSCMSSILQLKRKNYTSKMLLELLTPVFSSMCPLFHPSSLITWKSEGTY